MEVQNKQISDCFCSKHPDFRIELLQVSGFESNRPNQSLLHCLECSENDPNYKLSNYISFQKIIKSNQDEIHLKWPPIQDFSILNQLKLTQNINSNGNPIIDQIEQFFTEFKIEILKEIDACQKTMIEKAQDLQINNPEIINKYQQLSKIEELKNIFNNNKTSINEKENKYQELIKNIQTQSDNIIQQFNQMINQQTIITTFNIDSAQQIKYTILNQLKNITFFTSKPKLQPNNNKLISTFFQLDDQYKIKNKGQNIIKNKNNNEIQIQYKGGDAYQKVVSDLILNRNANYILKILLLPTNNSDYCYFYIVNETIKQQFMCNIGFGLKYDNNEIFLNSNQYKFKQIKGNGFKLSAENEVEIRINLNDQIFELLDYPLYNYHLQYSENNKLFELKNYRFYFNIPKDSKMKIVLKEAYTVDKFN